MGDAWAVALAVASALGAWAGGVAPLPWSSAPERGAPWGSAALGAWWAAVPWWWCALAGALAAVVALVRRWPWLLCVALLVLAGGLARRSWEAAAPLDRGPVQAEVTLLGDPIDLHGAVVVTARLGTAHVELWARRGPAGQLRGRLAGERVVVTGRLEPIAPSDARQLAERHLRGLVTVTGVTGWSGGSPVERAANRVRRTLADGASVLPREERALYLGFVLGDDREQSEALRDTFRAAGLAHLTAVSGQNVAYALAVAGPLLQRLGLRSRLAATVAVIAWFALLTRFEPSVLRAAAMASLAALSMFLARPASGVRLLSLAVAGLLLVDPLLVWSVGFLLSVGATAGIVVFSGRLAARLPGPRPLALAVAVTVAAQVGVAPVQLAVFGPLPVAALPANLLAGPVAGPVMIWGLPAGLAAGVLPGPLPTVLHLPTLLGVRWIALVARVGEAAPLGHVGAAGLVVGLVVVAAAAAWVVARRGITSSVIRMTWAGSSAERILERSTTLAVVGCSTKDWKHAHDVPRALQRRGFRIIPVHPTATEILGERAYPVLADVPDEIDTVVVFRPSAECGRVAEQAVAVGAKAVWLQLGLVSAEARAAAEAAGIGYVEDRCTKVVAAQLGLRK